jgi:hypothetical protein
MPVGRILLKSISDSNKLPKLKTDGARLLYTWLIAHLDINGCFSGDAQVINGRIFTRLSKSTKTIEDYLQDMEQAGLIIRYKSDGDTFLNVPDFVEKQPSLNPNREGKSNIPAPAPGLLRNYSVTAPTQVKLSKDKISKDKIKHRAHVFLTEEEHKKLMEQLGEAKTNDMIERLDLYIGSKGDKYKSHYMTILNWLKMDKDKGNDSGNSDAYNQAYKCFKSFSGGYCQTNYDSGDPKCVICKDNKYKWRSK